MTPFRTSVPIMYLEQVGGRQLRRFSSIWVDLPEISTLDAPVAIEWMQHERYGRDALEQFRLFDGKLFERYNALHYNRTSAADIKPMGVDVEPANWANVVVVDWQKVYGHPFMAPKSDQGPAGSIYDITYIPDAGDNPGFLKNAEISRRIASQSIIVDGGLWKPSVGPLIELRPWKNDGRRDVKIQYRHPSQKDYTLLDPMWVFSYRDEDLLHEMAREFFGVDHAATGNRPATLVADGYPLPKAELAAESAAWACLWDARRHHLDPNDRTGVEAVIALRKALDRRWSGIELDHYLTHHATALEHTAGRDIPEPTELIPALEAFLERGRHLLYDISHETLIRMTISRIQRQHQFVPEADFDALDIAL